MSNIFGIEIMEDFSESDLVLKAGLGDVDAFTQLAERYQAKIYHMIMRMTRNHCDTADLLQETFLQAFRSLPRFKRNSSFYTWLYRIAVNRTLTFLKKTRTESTRRRNRTFPIMCDGPDCSEVFQPEKRMLNTELKNQLDRAIQSLPAVYRAAFMLVEFEGLSHKQAAYALKCSEKTVSWRMHRARKMLQARLSPVFEGGRS